MAESLPTVDDFLDIAPEFSTVDPDRITRLLTRAAARCDQTYFGLLWPDAVCYLAAHILALATPGSESNGGGVTSKSADGLSISFGTLMWSARWYNATTYGREWYALVKSKSRGSFGLASSRFDGACPGDIIPQCE